MCVCLGRITIQEARNILNLDSNSAAPKDLSQRELAFQYITRETGNILKKLSKDFEENKAISLQSGDNLKATIVMVLLDTLQIIQRVFEAITFFLRYSTGVIYPPLVFRHEIKPVIPPGQEPSGGDFDISIGGYQISANVSKKG